jgi:hypothetical protein
MFLVSFVQPNKQDKPNKPNNNPIMGGISCEGKPAPYLAASRIAMVL